MRLGEFAVLPVLMVSVGAAQAGDGKPEPVPSAARVALIASYAPAPVSVNSIAVIPPASSARAISTARS